MSEDRNDLRCCLFVVSLLVILALSTLFIPYIVAFLGGYFYYWYISIPITAIFALILNYFVKRRAIRKAYMALNTPPYQTKFEHQTGNKALENDEITKEFREWLIEQVKPTKTRRRISIPYNDIKSFLILILFLVLLTAVYLWIYSLIFPNWYLPVEPWASPVEAFGGIPGYDIFIIIGITIIVGGIITIISFKKKINR